MKKLILVVTAGFAIAACSDGRDRRGAPVDNTAQRPDLTLPDTASLSDTTFMVSSRGSQPVSPVEEAPPAPRRRAKPARPVGPTKPMVDTSIRAYAPNPPRDTAPAAPDTAPGPDSIVIDSAIAQEPELAAPAHDSIAADTARARGSDTVVTPKSDSAIAPSPDTVATKTSDTTSTPAADTMVATSPAVAPATSTGASAGAKARTLPVGTEIHAALADSISSRGDTVGQIISAHVMENVTGPDGRTLIAAGAPVRFTITRIRAARSKTSQGRLAIRADGIALNGQLRPVKAEVRPVPRELRGRGITGKEAATVGAGAAGGAVLGRVVGGNTRGAVIGGVAGAAAGAVVANQTATRDVVVKAKTPVVIVLTEPLTTP
jgi:hypothetical protein